MRLSIDHRTTYRFSKPQARLVQMLRLTPEDTHDQTVVAWRIDVDCDARLRSARDGFGNKVTMLYAEGPLDGLEIAVTGEVLTSETPGVLKGALDPLPPAVFCRTTPLTEADGDFLGFVERTALSDNPLTRLHDLNGALNHRFRIVNARSDPARTASAAFAEERVTPRDLAQMMVAAARAIGAPARYVSGYCLSGFGGASRPTPHGWAEAYVDRIGWIAFDPCFGLSADENYVRVAVGLDAAGAAPVAGSRLGPGDEELAVDVSVDAVGDS
ncbi:MAG: transglutaminase N-terminal domain-containing protein [Pseudomonadota bacterium]